MRQWSEKFLSSMLNFSKRLNNQDKPVLVDDGSVLYIFKSQGKAAEYFGINQHEIGLVANGTQRSVRNMIVVRLYKER